MDILEGEDLMQTEDSEKYLGDIATNNGKNIKKTLKQEKIGIEEYGKICLQHL